MLKVSLVAREQDRLAIITRLQAVGVLELTPLVQEKIDDVEAEELNKNLEYQTLINRALAYLNQFKPSSRAIPPKSKRIEDSMKRVFVLVKSLEDLAAQINKLENDLELWSHFGQFRPSTTELAKVQIMIKLAKLKQAELASLKHKPCFVELIKQLGDNYYVAVFLTDDSSGAELAINFIDMPSQPLSAYQQELERMREKKRLILVEMASWYYQIHNFEKLKREAANYSERLHELQKTKREHGLWGVSGYVLAHEVHLLEKALDSMVVALKLETPPPASDVPVKLKNARYIKGFEAIGRAFSGVSYFEKDKTPLLALLFVIFGSLCLLDAGYGLLLYLAGYVVYNKKSRDFGQVFMWTGAVSTVLGILCGQFFGLVFAKDILLTIPPLLSLATEPLVCFQFSLLVGVSVMTLTNLVCIVQNGLNTNALGNLLALMAGLVLVIDHAGILYDPWIDYSWWLKNSAWLLLGLTAIAWIAFPEPVFGREQRVANIFWTIYSGPVGLIQDILSHMRLFGIALSGSILALVINKIAFMMPAPIGALFAPLGHLAVFLLSLLSLYIHTNRLIFLEFGSKCMTGGHHYFSPFGRKN